MSEEPREVLTPTQLGGLKTYRAGDIQDYECACIFGLNGVGKTPLVASANRVACFHPTLIINIDRGAKSLVNLEPDVQVVSPKSFGAIQRVFDSLHAMYKRGERPFNSIVVDGTTTAQHRGIDHLYYQEQPNVNFVDFKTAELANQGWSKSAKQMDIFFNAFTQLPVHRFFTAWVNNVAHAPEKIGETVPPVWVPAFTPAALQSAARSFDSILYMYMKDIVKDKKKVTVRILQSRATASVPYARDRGDRLPDAMENPTMMEMAKAWGLDCSPV